LHCIAASHRRDSESPNYGCAKSASEKDQYCYLGAIVVWTFFVIFCYAPARVTLPIKILGSNTGGFSMGVTRPPLEYLATCSKVALESFELARLNEASNLRKEVQQILQGWIDTEVDARLARWILDSKQSEADHRDGPRAAIAQLVRPQLDLSFLPPDGARAACAQAQENASEPDCRALQQREPEALSSAAGRAPEKHRKSSGMKRAQLLEKRAARGYLGCSAPAPSVPKPPFAQDEEDALHVLEHFVRRQPVASRAHLQNLAVEKNSHVTDERPRLAGRTADHPHRDVTGRHAEVRVFPSTEVTPTAVCRAYPLRAISISALELAIPAAAADH
jgi:hypothetical protein